MNKNEARRKLLGILDKEGVNAPDYLVKISARALTFNDVADAWEQKRLPQLKVSTRYYAPYPSQEASASILSGR